MEKINSLNQVAEFHQTFDAPILNTPQIPSKKRCALRVSLLAEELKELEKPLKMRILQKLLMLYAIYNTCFQVQCWNLALAISLLNYLMKYSAQI